MPSTSQAVEVVTMACSEERHLPSPDLEGSPEFQEGPQASQIEPGQEGEPSSEPLSSESLEATIEALRADLERYKEEAERNWIQFLHAASDLENYKREAQRRLQEAVERTKRSLLLVILEVVDTLERALRYSDTPGNAESILEGIRLAHRQILETLANLGVRPVETVGQPFDPRTCEAVEAVPAESSGNASGTVVEEIQRGYTINGEVLRPARVKVAR
ncbi:MAG: nucleotide exchange factor GrpE [Armatimonadota bacterium]|nr:nucleotide exchange factor GrpE [Armatimonadota bacterium]